MDPGFGAGRRRHRQHVPAGPVGPRGPAALRLPPPGHPRGGRPHPPRGPRGPPGPPRHDRTRDAVRAGFLAVDAGTNGGAGGRTDVHEQQWADSACTGGACWEGAGNVLCGCDLGVQFAGAAGVREWVGGREGKSIPVGFPGPLPGDPHQLLHPVVLPRRTHALARRRPGGRRVRRPVGRPASHRQRTLRSQGLWIQVRLLKRGRPDGELLLRDPACWRPVRPRGDAAGGEPVLLCAGVF
mmetsp:Transcript_107951/g.247529  ORF Transcript_107951/g.247529 Transcript_107951/m.247529 type:complete len:240 (+) Transcript_107951:769-1488(+)